ncbi:SDR family NAD(P)-dependent oxidoreductase [Aetokthonos hydrillicola Thurmond2011]|uniref:SDR family NAD(P)-dependent oxidoreductase n=1 Tax=Aetokthonos hydrillicola Thurmond2011 TaxID=2712845 RepID=A0AAP5M9N7_9CYAN|nr:SDR family NAD(P)-dependent oxidoreductase [Aetokthonos hydrillicola]MBO3464077.1 SDR family NAD(P)-dependent oxidoreductase [Aetokthonos hydrillicola CCALA 1050]MBW4586282.1 SDR family NAD(P)-dependent oxidoreductase [Aetokthonos hydrillicola CCALA 1050]MDR9897410.1 SDR family NAD(P)-dependent oxidoreductase [Aetokthonos hydrillicola Thurmond2011]
MKTIAGKTVLLTGASGGIGVFIARALAREKATIISVSRSQEKLDEISTEVEAAGGRGISIPFDISKVEELSVLVQQINQVAGSIDILINNAAIEKYRPFQNYSLQDIQSILTTNLVAGMELTRLLLPGMIDRNSGHIVNIASGSGKKGAPYNSIYSATKAGLIMWTDAIRQELVDTNVGVSVICPGYTKAGMFLKFGLPAPSLARVSEPTDVAIAVLQAIKQNQGEVMLDGFLTRLLFSNIQIFPQFGDAIYKWIGLTKLNKACAENQMRTENFGEK